MLRSARRKIPWILVFEAAMLMRQRWTRLPPHDRARLAELARKSGGSPLRLTKQERSEFRRIAGGLDLFGLAREFTPLRRRWHRH
jgi:hypothetical protein